MSQKELNALYDSLSFYDKLITLYNAYDHSKVHFEEKNLKIDAKQKYQDRVAAFVQAVDRFVERNCVSPILEIKQKSITIGFHSRNVNGFKTLEVDSSKFLQNIKLPIPESWSDIL